MADKAPDYTPPPPPPGPFTGKMDKSRLRDDLLECARYLGIVKESDKPSLTKAVLADLIGSHIKDHAEDIAKDPITAGLVVYNRHATVEHHSQSRTRSSATKAAEDAAEQAKEAAKPLEPTAALKKLVDSGMPVDPPPSFTPTKTTGAPSPISSPLTPVSSPSSDNANKSSAAGTPESDEVQEIQMPESTYLAVNFLNYNNRAQAKRTVILDGAEFIDGLSAAGHSHITAKLEKVLPAALNQDTPVKERGGNIHRRHPYEDDGTVNLGNIEALLRGVLRPGHPPGMKQVLLGQPKRQDGRDIYSLDLFHEESTQNQQIMPVNEANGNDVPEVQPFLTVDEKVIGKEKHAAFVKYLKARLNEGGQLKKWLDKAKTAEDLRQRYLYLEDLLKYVQIDLECGQDGGKFVVKDPSSKFDGYSFTKTEIAMAGGLGRSTAMGIWGVFGFKGNVPELQAWLDKPNGPYERSLGGEAAGTFQKYIRGRAADPSKEAIQPLNRTEIAPSGTRKRLADNETTFDKGLKRKKEYVEPDDVSSASGSDEESKSDSNESASHKERQLQKIIAEATAALKDVKVKKKKKAKTTKKDKKGKGKVTDEADSEHPTSDHLDSDQ